MTLCQWLDGPGEEVILYEPVSNTIGVPLALERDIERAVVAFLLVGSSRFSLQ